MSDCNACIYTGVDSCDGPEFESTSIVKARKNHSCCECAGVIVVGSQYERVVGKWDEDISVYKTCLPCAEIRQAFCCDGWVYGQLWNDAIEGEFFEHMTTGCLEKLTTAAAKQFLIKRWNEWKFRR